MATKHLIHIENTGERYLCAEDENLLRGMEMLGRKGIPVGAAAAAAGVRCTSPLATTPPV